MQSSAVFQAACRVSYQVRERQMQAVFDQQYYSLRHSQLAASERAVKHYDQVATPNIITAIDEDSTLRCFDYADFNTHHSMLTMFLLNLTWNATTHKTSAAELLAIIEWFVCIEVSR